jgi:diacylglycerol kinase (ATP)
MRNSLIHSFWYALEGIRYCVKTERNFRIHLIVMAYMFFFSLFYPFGRAEYMILIIVCGLVLAAEMVNTSIERIVNLQTKNYDFLAKAAKDVAAGAVLVFTVAAVLVGLFLFCDPSAIARIFFFLTGHFLHGALFLFSLVLSYLFVREKR